MTKQRKQFSPHIYPEWGELFDTITAEQRGELLLAITKYPEYEPKDVPIWNFIKSQIQKDYEIFIEKCEKNGEISRNYWQNKKSNDTERISNDTERHPKRITNNELRITKTNNELQAKKTNKFLPPTLEEVRAYCKERNNHVDAQQFYDYYSVANWKDSKGTTLKNWKQKIIAVWEKKNDKKEQIRWDY